MSGNIGGNSLQYDVIQQGSQYGIMRLLVNLFSIGWRQASIYAAEAEAASVNLKIEKLEDPM